MLSPMVVGLFGSFSLAFRSDIPEDGYPSTLLVFDLIWWPRSPLKLLSADEYIGTGFNVLSPRLRGCQGS